MLYNKLFNSIYNNTNDLGTEANSNDKQYYQVYTERMNRVQSCEDSGNSISYFNQCNDGNIVGEHIIPNKIVCCKNTTINASGVYGNGMQSQNKSSNQEENKMRKCSNNIPDWFKYDIDPEREVDCNRFCGIVKDQQKTEKDCKDNNNCEIKYKWQGLTTKEGKLPPFCNDCRSGKAMLDGKEATQMAYQLGYDRFKNNKNNDYFIANENSLPQPIGRPLGTELLCKDNKDCCFGKNQNNCNNPECQWCISEGPDGRVCRILENNGEYKKIDNKNVVICSGKGAGGTCVPRYKVDNEVKNDTSLPFSNIEYYKKGLISNLKHSDFMKDGKPNAYVLDYPFKCKKQLSNEELREKADLQKKRAKANFNPNKNDPWDVFCSSNAEVSSCCEELGY